MWRVRDRSGRRRRGGCGAPPGPGALLVPFVSSRIAGAALAGFSAGLIQPYLKTPGMRQPGSLKPTPDGIGLAKDVWMFGIGTGLVLGGLTDDVRGLAKDAKKATTS